MEQTQQSPDGFPAAMAVTTVFLLFLIFPILYATRLLFKTSSLPEDAKRSKFWNQMLWCIALVLYGAFAIPATCYMAYGEVSYSEMALGVLVCLVPLFYIWPSIVTYNLTNTGLLIILGYDVCLLAKGIWFIPKFFAQVIAFTTTKQEYQFPDDSVGEEHDATITISTGEHIISVTDKADSSVKPSFKKAGELGDEDVLGQIMMLDVSLMISFTFEDARKLFKNFGDIYMAKGETGVSEEIARQVRDHMVAAATALFPQYTAKEIFEKLKKEINADILTEIKEIVAEWGIKINDVKFATVKYSAKVETYLDSIVEGNAKAITHYLEAQKDAKAYEIWTKVMNERATLLNGEGGDKLALITLMETAVKVAANSTNYNFGGQGVSLVDILGKIATGMDGSKFTAKTPKGAGEPVA